ncbi:MAG: hypothetical protein WCK48_00125 [bacterium]
MEEIRLVEPIEFRKPIIISTKDSRLSEVAGEVCNHPWVASHEASHIVIRGHGPIEVIAVHHWMAILSDLERLGYMFADPITFCEFISKKGWPVHRLKGALRVGTIWDDRLLIGFAFHHGSRIDFENFLVPDLVIMMKSPT